MHEGRSFGRILILPNQVDPNYAMPIAKFLDYRSRFFEEEALRWQDRYGLDQAVGRLGGIAYCFGLMVTASLCGTPDGLDSIICCPEGELIPAVVASAFQKHRKALI